MIGAHLPPSSPLLFPATPLGPASAPALDRAGGPAWLDGLGASGVGAILRADVPAGQRGLSVQQHADRVLAALVAG